MENNLRNITEKDRIYQLIQYAIRDHLPQELKIIFDNVPQIGLIATDSYFLHYSVYPMLKGVNPDQVMEQARKMKLEYMVSQKYQAIKPITTLDDQMSLVYSISLAKTILEKIKKQVEENYENQTGQRAKFQQIINQATLQHGKNYQQQIQKQIQKAFQQLTKQQLLKGSGKTVFQELLQKSMEKAKKDTETAKKVRDLLGGKEAGKEPGTFQKIIDLTDQIKKLRMKDILTYSEKLITDMPKFSKIGKVKDKHGTEIAGYRTTRNVAEALPRELALPEELFLKKLSNGFLAREKQRVAEGAFYVLIDKSGSMDGEKTVWSRSVALALFRLAQQKRRKYFLRFFDTEVYPSKAISERDEIIDHIIRIQSDGGTDITHAISTAVKDIVENKLSEYTNTIVIITDGEDEIDKEKLQYKLKENNIKLISVMIKGTNESLKEISDSYFKTELTSEDALTLIREAEK